MQKKAVLWQLLGEDFSKINVDGNLKLKGSMCGRPIAELTHCDELGLCATTPCTNTPWYKERRCPEHDPAQALEHPEDLQEEAIVAHRGRVLSRLCCARAPLLRKSKSLIKCHLYQVRSNNILVSGSFGQVAGDSLNLLAKTRLAKLASSSWRK